MTDEHARMEKLLEVEAAPAVPQLHPMRWIHENLFPSPISGLLTLVTVVAVIGFVYGILSWIFAPQRALVPEGVTTVDEFVLDITLDDLARVNRVEPGQAVESGDLLALSTSPIEWEVPAGVDDVTGFAGYLLTSHDAAGWVPAADGSVDEAGDPVLERVTGLDPGDYLTTAADVVRLNGLSDGAALVPGETYRVEGSARQWDAISTNSRNYFTLAYPTSQYLRVWLSFGIVCALVGLSLAAWTRRPRLSSARMARRLTIFGSLFAGIAVLAPWSVVPDAVSIVVGAGLAVVGFLGRRRLLRRNDGDREDVSLMGVLLAVLATLIGLMWLLPEVVGKMEIAATTKVPLTVMALVAVGGFWVGKAIKASQVSLGALKGTLIALWALSMPVIYLVILRDPQLTPEGVSVWSYLADDLAASLVVAALGAVLLWFMSGRSAGEAGKAVSGVLVLAAFLSWFPYEVFTVGAVLVVGAVIAVVWFLSGPSAERAMVAAALLAAAVAVWSHPTYTEMTSPGVVETLWGNPWLEMIKVKLLLGGLASFGLAASTFGGNERSRISLVVGWGAAAFLVTFFSIVSEGATSLQLESDPIGGMTLTVLLAFGGILLSFPIGVLLALGRTSTMPIFRLLSTSYIEAVRGVPLITVLFFGALFLPIFLPTDLRVAASLKALIAITGFSGAYLAENVRGGLQSISRGQYEASQALGMSTVQMTIFITLPQALRAVIPALVGQVIALFKDTSLVAIVGLADLLLVARAIVPGQPAFIGSQLENLAFVAIVYWIFTFSFSRASLRIERKLGLGER
ncbi:MAG: amino acid ABC transporter permease [Actinobacteria bacterium]|nr:amino acid ABC transporter permease [Actinomycetota bacterium]